MEPARPTLVSPVDGGRAAGRGCWPGLRPEEQPQAASAGISGLISVGLSGLISVGLSVMISVATSVKISVRLAVTMSPGMSPGMSPMIAPMISQGAISLDIFTARIPCDTLEDP